MAAGGAIQVDGARRLRATLKRAGIDVQDLKDTHKAIAQMIADRSDARAPRRSGALAADVRAFGRAAEAVVSVGRKSIPYAGPVHWGWPRRNIAPNPWIWQTAQDNNDRSFDMARDAIAQIIDRIEGTHTS